MRIKNILPVLIVLICHQIAAQSINKITGPLAVYHITPGYVYGDSTGTDSVLMEYEFRFGELYMCNQAFDQKFYFEPEIDSCVAWNANRVLGIVQPVTEEGVYNQPADTSLYFPYPQVPVNGPGIIQGAQRFSRLSQLYGPVCGIMLDDWDRDVPTTGQVRDAVQGKYVDADGNVNSQSIAITPDNKVYGVIYDTGYYPATLPVIDGISYWYVDVQNCCYTKLDSDITHLRANYPGKEIMVGIYIVNSHIGWTTPVSIQYMLEHALNRYDDGDLSSVIIDPGSLIVDTYMPLSNWNADQLPFWLDSLYYPFLGEGQGRLFDCNAESTLPGAFVRVFCQGRLSGDTFMRSRQLSGANGQYQFGLWAGNRNTDSTYYWLVAEKAGYISDTVGFWIKRGDTTTVPDLHLCPEVSSGKEGNIFVFPEPTNGNFTLEWKEGGATSGELDIYNVLGQQVFSAGNVSTIASFDLSTKPSGIYIVRIRTGEQNISLSCKMVLVH